ncbi:MAG: hypothetical protein FWH07_08420, partial [Oscillospiraceae bacterium]|nr:hypothetical protein [Oscillospiraceae bacterium]
SLGEYIRTRTECQEHPTERKCNEEHRCFGGVLYAVEKIMTTLRAVADDDEQRQLCEFVDSLVKKP